MQLLTTQHGDEVAFQPSVHNSSMSNFSEPAGLPSWPWAASFLRSVIGVLYLGVNIHLFMSPQETSHSRDLWSVCRGKAEKSWLQGNLCNVYRRGGWFTPLGSNRQGISVFRPMEV